MLVGSVHLAESVDKLPQELVIPSDQIQLLESIGQGGLCFGGIKIHYHNGQTVRIIM